MNTVMCLLTITLAQVGQSVLIGFAMLLAFGQLLFPAKARIAYIVLQELRGVIVNPASPALTNYVLRFYALATILALILVELMMVGR